VRGEKLQRAEVTGIFVKSLRDMSK
jgi:hypothetical protein